MGGYATSRSRDPPWGDALTAGGEPRSRRRPSHVGVYHDFLLKHKESESYDAQTEAQYEALGPRSGRPMLRHHRLSRNYLLLLSSLLTSPSMTFLSSWSPPPPSVDGRGAYNGRGPSRFCQQLYSTGQRLSKLRSAVECVRQTQLLLAISP